MTELQVWHERPLIDQSTDTLQNTQHDSLLNVQIVLCGRKSQTPWPNAKYLAIWALFSAIWSLK